MESVDEAVAMAEHVKVTNDEILPVLTEIGSFLEAASQVVAGLGHEDKAAHYNEVAQQVDTVLGLFTSAGAELEQLQEAILSLKS